MADDPKVLNVQTFSDHGEEEMCGGSTVVFITIEKAHSGAPEALHTRLTRTPLSVDDLSVDNPYRTRLTMVVEEGTTRAQRIEVTRKAMCVDAMRFYGGELPEEVRRELEELEGE